MRDVVITGLGLCTPMGHSLAEVREVLRRGQPVIQGVAALAGHLRAYAKVQGDIGGHFTPAQRQLYDRATQFALIAGQSALVDSGVSLEDMDRTRIGVFMGTGQGGLSTLSDSAEALHQRDHMPAMTVLKGLPNGSASHLSMVHQLQGECATVTVACASSNIAIGMGLRAIRHGYLDAALVGGADAPLCELSLRGWEALRILAKVDPAQPHTCCRPFAQDRTGLALGEGGVVYLLEAADDARARGARIHARVAGYGASADATHITAPDAEGQVRAMHAALRDAGLQPADIAYINAHGTATPAGDVAETQSMRAVFGAHADSLAISSTKAIHGHLLGTSGAIELLAALLALREGLIAPTANLENADPACDLDFVALHSREGPPLAAAMSNSFAFGGSNASLIVTRH